MSKYDNTVGIWPRAVECKNGTLMVGSGLLQTKKKKVNIVMFANLPEKAPEELVELHEEYWTALNDYAYKLHKKAKKKGKSNPPFFKIQPSNDS
jgi:hypothetical protein